MLTQLQLICNHFDSNSKSTTSRSDYRGIDSIIPQNDGNEAPDWVQEFRRSAIPDRLTFINVEWIDGDDAIEILTETKISEVQSITSFVGVAAGRILNNAGYIRAGGWFAWGTTLEGGQGATPYIKPLTPRQSYDYKGFGAAPKSKIVKYETPQGMSATPLLPWVDAETAQIIFDRYHVKPEDEETFWQVVKRCNIPIAITEGLKKALALIAHGIPAIGIRGITQWRIKGTDELHPTIADFAAPGRKVTIFFDQDEKLSTQKNVRIQILKLGEALGKTKCRPFIALWNMATGKGVDDALYALGAGAQVWLDSVIGDAPDLKTYKRDSRILQNLEAIKELNTLTYPVERATTGGYLPELPEIKKGTITVLSASMNAGKTTRIGQDYVKPWTDRGGLVLVLTPINNLGKQAANDWSLPHLHDYHTDQASQSALWTEVNHMGGIVMCVESLHRLPDWFWSKSVLFVWDEANQITDGLTQGDTLGSRFSDILERVTAASRHSIATGAIVLSEDRTPDRAVKFMQTISGCNTVEVITHRKVAPWDVTLYRGQASGYRAKFLEVAKTQKLLYVASSQREGQRIERAMAKLYPDRKVVRIDSKTNQGAQFTGFFEQPDRWLEENKPDILILSPSAKSGVSIEGGVSVEDAYFSAVWGYFPALGTDTHSQLLGRYRPAVPRIAFCPDMIMTTGDESLFSSRAIRRRLKLNATAIAGAYGIAGLLTDDEGNELRGTIETAVMDYLCDAREVSGSQKRIAHHALASRLNQAGHNVESEVMKADPSTTELWEIINDELWHEEAAVISAAVVEPMHTLEWARKALDGLETSLETRLLAQKCIWRSDFPGMMFDCEIECYKALTRDYGAMGKGVKLQAKAENLDGARIDDEALTKQILSGNIRALHRIPKSHIQALLIAQSGVLELLDGTIYTNEDARCQKVKQWALKTSKEIAYWCGLYVHEDQTEIEICHKFLRRLGLQRDKSDQKPGRTGAIKMVGRKGPRGDNSEQFRIDLSYDPIRARLLEAARRKLSESVTSISNKDNLPLEIDVTNCPETFPDQIDCPINEGESFYFEYDPSEDDLTEWAVTA